MAIPEPTVPTGRTPLRPHQELIEGATRVVYKKIDGHELALHIFGSASATEQPRAAALFFYSSFWDKGAVGQFAPHCAYFAARGMLTMAVEYRVSSVHGTGPLEAIADARSAFRWVRLNAGELGGIDPDKILGVGGSGGGYLVAAAGLFDNLDEEGENQAIKASPDAAFLLSPILDLSKKGAGMDRFEDPKVAKALSPVAQVTKGLPPTLICHGTEDRLVPFRGSAEFTRKMRRKKNVCQLIEFQGQEHSFFNFNVNMQHYEATLSEADRFLVEQGFLEADDEASSRLLGSL